MLPLLHACARSIFLYTYNCSGQNSWAQITCCKSGGCQVSIRYVSGGEGAVVQECSQSSLLPCRGVQSARPISIETGFTPDLPTTKVNFDPAPLHVRKHAVRNLSALAVNLIRDSSKLTAFCSCCCTPMVVKSQGSLIRGALRMFLLHMLVLAPLELYLKADRDLIFFFAQSFI